MSSQREHSLDSLLGDIRELKERMGQVSPSYTILLKGLTQLPDEFECRFWASRLEALLQMVEADYDNFQAKAQRVDLVGKFMKIPLDMMLKARGMEPLPLPESLPLGISISPSGTIVPDWMDNPNREPGAIFVTYEEFVAIAQRLKDKLIKGPIVPSSEDEIPKIIYHFTSSKK